MTADRSAAELERFLAERADHLLRAAVLLTGSKEAGEDLLQTAVGRLLRRWRRFDGEPEGVAGVAGNRIAGASPTLTSSPATTLSVWLLTRPWRCRGCSRFAGAPRRPGFSPPRSTCSPSTASAAPRCR